MTTLRTPLPRLLLVQAQMMPHLLQPLPPLVLISLVPVRQVCLLLIASKKRRRLCRRNQSSFLIT